MKSKARDDVSGEGLRSTHASIRTEEGGHAEGEVVERARASTAATLHTPVPLVQLQHGGSSFVPRSIGQLRYELTIMTVPG